MEETHLADPAGDPDPTCERGERDRRDATPRERNDEQKASQVGDHPGRHQQQATDDDQRALHQALPRRTALTELLRERGQHPEALSLRQPRAHDPRQQHQHDRRGRPEPRAELQQQEQVDHRDHGKQQKQAEHHGFTDSYFTWFHT